MNSKGKQPTKKSHQTVTARTEAAMAAIMQLRQELATETQIGKADSAYMTVRGIIYDLLDGAYSDGYSTGEDSAP
ncbi:hypothetical protein [Rhizobium sp. 1399]|jgi:hypothetical protein|uniref:hypothetical protein n=1 Tax=unclassified Rhizobium TaxID=2613769 RepID=UPI00285E166C|nr:hypothetical protein [Rhizobium sp. 1399]MDR6667239.1 hypothetical protein [Rhizobium sp. 1399]